MLCTSFEDKLEKVCNDQASLLEQLTEFVLRQPLFEETAEEPRSFSDLMSMLEDLVRKPSQLPQEPPRRNAQPMLM
jgi:hypothetical protein